MKRSLSMRGLTLLLALLMAVSIMPATAMADEMEEMPDAEESVLQAEASSEEIEETEIVETMAVEDVAPVLGTGEFVSETHDTFSTTKSTIAPGVTQSINYAYAKDGKQMVYYVATADINRDDVMVQASYFNQYENETFGMSKLTDQMAYADALFTNKDKDSFISEYYKAVVGTNGDFYNMSTGQPSGAFVINGVQASNKANNRPWFAIFADGTALCGVNNTDWDAAVTAHGAVQQAVGGSQMLVKNGADVTASASGSYNTDRHSRTCVGVTADGKVVMMVLDGRQEPFSCGGSMHELAQIMLEAGCVSAINLDGGGSTTYASRPEGKNEVEIVNRPSDGSERAISSALIIASLAAPSDVFDRAVLTAENAYVTPNSVVKINATGVSPAGTAAQIPENAVWQLADDTMGTIENGVFTANGNVGAAVVQLVVDGVVVGETTVYVAIPDLAFDTAQMTVPFNKTFKLAVSGTTNNGMNEVVLKDSDLIFELSDPAMGTIDGAYYTSCDDTASITGGTITVKCVYDETKTDTATVTFGKASVIAEDFEDGNMDGWSAKSAYARKDKGHLTFGRFESYDLKLVDASTGKVRNGNYAMEIVADFATTTASGYKAIKYSFPAIDLTGATTFGMWMYLPVADVHNLEFDIGGYEYYIEDDANIGDEGWYYITAPAATVGSSVSSFTIYMTDPDETYFNIFNKYSVYVDDLTIDYSNATEDREIPKFSKVTVVTGLDNETAMNGQVYSENVITVKAYAAENLSGNYTGLDISTAKVYVDGVALNASAYYCDERGVINVGNLSLADGTHAFRFEIKDKAGNTGFVTKKIIINTADGDVYLTRRSDVPQPLAGSVDYYDVIAKNIEAIESLTMTIDLDTLNQWEFEGAEVLYGFELDYSVEARSNTATITVTKTGDVEATGEAILVAIPVRVWSTPSYLMQKYIDAGVVSNDPKSNESMVISTPYVMWQTDRTRLVRIEMAVESAIVDYADGTSATFASLPLNVITEHNRYRSAGYYTADGRYVTGDVTFCKQGKESLHVHSEAVAMEDKAATCTTDGYTGRTYCEACGSVIAWGTKQAATGHIYTLVDGVLKCACDKLFNGVWEDGKTYVDGVAAADGWAGDSYYVDGVMLTGIQKVEGFYYNFGEDGVCAGQTKYTGLFVEGEKTYYVMFGELATGWRMLTDGWYYFDETTGAGLSGDHVINVDGVDVPYSFEENGKLVSDVWYTNSSNQMYRYYGPGYYTRVWKEIDGKTYFLNWVGVAARGVYGVQDSPHMPEIFYLFDLDTCELIDVVDGFMTYGGNTYYYHTRGANAPAYGFWQIDGYYYYFSTSTGAMKTGDYTVMSYNSNGMLTENRSFHFDETHGYAVDQDGNPLTTLETETPDAGYPKFVEKDGKTYYYRSADALAFGFWQIDGYYYYFSTSTGQMRTGDYTVPHYASNGLLTEARTFHFDETHGYAVDKDGNPLTSLETQEPAESYPKFVEKDGKTYYYRSADALAFGFWQIDGYYYYFSTSTGEMRTGDYTVVAYTSNGLLTENRTFHFDETHGYAVDQDGNPLTTLETETPDAGYPKFVEKDGKTYYYRSADALAFGFWQIDGYYYYFSTSTGEMRTGDYTVQSYASNGLLDTARQFHFDETHGYAVDENGEPLTTLESQEPVQSYPKFVEKNGKTYYYRSAEALAFGFWQIDGYYYYFSTSTGEMRTGDYTVQPYASNGLLSKATKFHFDETHGYAVDANGDPITSLS